MKNILVCAFSFAIVGCTTTSSQSGSTEYLETSSRLFIEDGDGDFKLPTGRTILGIDNTFSLGGGYVLLLPGEHVITHACPTLPDGILGMHGAPSIVYRFEANKDYELRCKDGFINIVPRVKDEA